MGPAKKNVLTFGMVSIPVGLVSATKSASGTGLRMIAPVEKDGDGNLPERANAVKQVYYDPDEVKKVKGEEVVPLSALRTSGECGRGVPIGGNGDGGEAVRPIDTAAYDELAESLDYMDLVGFVPEKDFVAYRDRVCGAHYVQPQPGSAKALGTLAKTMRKERVVGVVKFSVGARERVGALAVRDDGAVEALTLSFRAQWKDPDEEVLATNYAEPTKAERDMAGQLVRALTVDASVIDDMEDGSAARQAQMIEQALAGATPGAAVAVGEAPDLMEQLEASIALAKKAKRRKKVAA